VAFKLVLVDEFPIDCAISESHEIENEVTSFPVETGGMISDHVISKNKKLVLEGVVSDTPVGDMVGVRESLLTLGDQLATGVDETAALPSRKALDKLEELDRTKRAVTVVSTLKEYRNMVLERLSVPVSSDKSGGLFFTATFVQVTFKQIARTKVAAPAAMSGAGLGDRTKKDASIRGIRCVKRNPNTGECELSEAVSKKSGEGKWRHPNGQPLTDQEHQDWSNDIQATQKNKATYDKAQGTWVDDKTKKPISKYPGRAYFPENSSNSGSPSSPIQKGKMTQAPWERHPDHLQRGIE
jgi:hypothetical protein